MILVNDILLSSSHDISWTLKKVAFEIGSFCPFDELCSATKSGNRCFYFISGGIVHLPFSTFRRFIQAHVTYLNLI